MDKKKSISIVPIIVFVGLTLLGTFTSRVVRGYMTPVVETSRAISGEITHTINSEAYIKGDSVGTIYIEPDIRVEQVFVSEGDLIEEREPLLLLNCDDIRTKELEEKAYYATVKNERAYSSGAKKEYLTHIMEESEKKSLLYESYIENNGMVFSEYAGIVKEMQVHNGQKTMETASFVVALTADEYLVELPISKEDSKYVMMGDAVELATEEGTERTTVLTVSSDENEENILTFKVSGDKFSLGDKVQAKIINKSMRWDMVVPLMAIRSDELGQYVLVEREKDTILGKELYAQKVRVSINDSNNELVAIQSTTLSKEDRIIINANKQLEAGDIVREK